MAAVATSHGRRGRHGRQASMATSHGRQWPPWPPEWPPRRRAMRRTCCVHACTCCLRARTRGPKVWPCGRRPPHNTTSGVSGRAMRCTCCLHARTCCLHVCTRGPKVCHVAGARHTAQPRAPRARHAAHVLSTCAATVVWRPSITERRAITPTPVSALIPHEGRSINCGIKRGA